MNFRRFSIVLLLSLAFGTARSSAQSLSVDDEGRYRFRVGVDMVRLSVTALEREGRLIAGLTRDDFSVYEDGIKQEIKVFSREDLPLRMSILLDASGSMHSKMSVAQEAAVRFVGSLKPVDQVKVVKFNQRVSTLVDFTSDHDKLARAIRQTVPGGSTSLYNAVYISLRGLSGGHAGVERQAMVLLSDGNDTKSLVSFEDVRELGRQAGVMIYSCLLASPEDLKTKDEYILARYELNRLATETGGSALIAHEVKDLGDVYDRIASELERQYNLGYVSTNSRADGSWRRIQVVSERPGVELRTRTGYYAPRASARSRVLEGRPAKRVDRMADQNSAEKTRRQNERH